MTRRPFTLIATGSLVLILAGCKPAEPVGPDDNKPIVHPSLNATALKKGNTATRRNVKTATDPDAAKIDKTPRDTTIEDIVAQKPPEGLKLAGRVDPFETSTWRVKATLQSIQLMKDGDYYLVMKGYKGGETVVEVPDPKEAKDSPLASQIAAARQDLQERFHPTAEVQKLNVPATVTGVGFLGFGGSGKGKEGAAKDAPKDGAKPGATGTRRTGARLMPGTGFDFGDGK